MDIDYASEIRSLDIEEEIYPLSAIAYKLMLKLYHFAELQGFPDRFRLPNSVLEARCGCSENSLNKARQELVNHGLLVYERGRRRDASPEYAIQYYAKRGSREKEGDGVLPQNLRQNDFYLKICGKAEGKTGGKTEGKTEGKTAQGVTTPIQGFGYVSYQQSNNNIYTTSSDRNGKGTTSYKQGDTERGTTSSVTPERREKELEYYYYYHKKRAREPEYAKTEQQHKGYGLTMIESDAARAAYGSKVRDVRDMIVEARYPYELIATAIGISVNRWQKGTVHDPYRYTIAMLEDWVDRGIYTADEIWQTEERKTDEQGDDDRQSGQRPGADKDPGGHIGVQVPAGGDPEAGKRGRQPGGGLFHGGMLADAGGDLREMAEKGPEVRGGREPPDPELDGGRRAKEIRGGYSGRGSGVPDPQGRRHAGDARAGR